MDSHKNEVVSALEAMGFEAKEIERAWHASDIKTVEGLINWMDLHPPNSDPIPAPAPTAAPQPFVQNISGLVKPELVKALLEQGSSQIVAEKAVLFSGNKDLEAALAWINEHKGDPDFNDPVQVEQKPGLSPEEARARAKELQKQIREKALQQDKENELAAERLRLAQGKELAEAKRVLEETKKRLDIEAYVREKNQAEREREEMLRVLEEDRRQKLGDKFRAKEQGPKSTKEGYSAIYDKMYKVYRMGQLEVLRTCLSTLATIVGNVAKSPGEEKFRRINATNPNFCARVKDVIGGTNMLAFIGFKEEAGFLVMHEPDLAFLNEVKALIENSLAHLATL